MRMLIPAIAVALFAACAPDSIRRDREFETWLGEMRQACERARIGTTTVGGLLNSTGSREGNNFLNFTSRLYAGQIDAETWTNNVVSFLRGRSTDPGVQCVLERVPKR